MQVQSRARMTPDSSDDNRTGASGVTNRAGAQIGDIVITADDLLVGVVREITDTTMVVAPDADTEAVWYLPGTAMSENGRFNLTFSPDRDDGRTPCRRLGPSTTVDEQ